jgi:hypothetical protein
MKTVAFDHFFLPFVLLKKFFINIYLIFINLNNSTAAKKKELCGIQQSTCNIQKKRK